MCNEALEWARDVRGVTALQKVILMVLADHKNGKTGLCNPSQRTIAEECCIGDVKTVRRNLEDLEKAGLIEQPEKGPGRGRSTRYILRIDRLDPAKDPPEMGAPCPHLAEPEMGAFDPLNGGIYPSKRGQAMPPEPLTSETSARDARPTRQDGRTRRSPRGAGTARRSELTLDDLAVPLGLKDFGRAVASRLGVVKTNHFLAECRFVQHSELGCPLVVAPQWIAQRVEDAGREFLRANGWKVRAS